MKACGAIIVRCQVLGRTPGLAGRKLSEGKPADESKTHQRPFHIFPFPKRRVPFDFCWIISKRCFRHLDHLRFLAGCYLPELQSSSGDLKIASLSRGVSWVQCTYPAPVILRSPPFLLACDEGSRRFPCKIGRLARISHHGSGRAGLQPRRYKAFLIIPVFPAPRSPSADGLRGARDQQRAGAAISAGLKPRPSGSPLRASKRGEKSGLAVRKNRRDASLRSA